MAVKVIERRRSLRHACVGDLPAPMIRGSDSSLLPGTLVDASRIGLGFISGTDLQIGEGVVFAFVEQPLKLVVAAKVPLSGTKQFRYGLMVIDQADDIEARLRAVGGILAPEGATSSRVTAMAAAKSGRSGDYRAARYTIDWELCVEARTLGTKVGYRLQVANISRSGLLVTTFQKDVAPFLVNTLIDIIIDPDSKCMIKPVHGFAKVVRHVVDKDPGSGGKTVAFGLTISEVFAEDKAVWEGLMRTLEKDAEIYTE